MSPLTRFYRYTTQDEPVITAGVLAAFALYLIDRYLHLTEDDLTLLGLLLVPIAGAVLARFKAYSPTSAQKAADEAYQQGLEDASN